MKVNKENLYVALKAIIRVKKILLKNGYFIDNSINNNIEKIRKIILSENTSSYNYSLMMEEIDKFSVDFEDADGKEAIFNYFIFAFSTLIYYFVNESESSLEGTCEDVIQFYRNIAEENYLKNNGLDVVILTINQIDEIENNSLILNEINAQEKDKQYAKTVIDWSIVKI